MSQILEIKDKLDIVDIIGERVSLQRSGKNLRGLCPFHSEKSPSFFVSPDTQRFHCFGCKKNGDVFTFIQEFDRLTFRETLELLANRAGIALEQQWQDPKEEQRKQGLEILELTQKYYSYLLQEHEVAAHAREYLQERGTQSTTVKHFELGYAPKSWDSLCSYLIHKKKFSEEDVIASGLALRGKSGKVYDRFRDRLMFPLHDHRGRVVGFSGRILDATAKEAKYINTPETELYHKRYLLYGYWQNLEFIKEKESVIIMEGEFDMLSSVEAHVQNVVAIKGSALTEEQIRILSRTVQTLYLALDADEAGVTATKRAIELVQAFPVALRVIPLTGGKDPDELAHGNPAQWRALVKNHVSAFEYILNVTLQHHDKTSAQGQKMITNIMFDVLKSIEHAVERVFYHKQLAEVLGIPENVILEQWESYQRGLQAKQLSPRAARKTAEEEQAENTESQKTEELSTDTLGEYWLHLLLNSEHVAHPIPVQIQWFEVPIQKRVVENYLQFCHDEPRFDLARFARHLPAELQEILSLLSLKELPLEQNAIEQELRFVSSQLEQRWKKQHAQILSQKLSVLEKQENLSAEQQAEMENLQRELATLFQKGQKGK